MSGFGYLDVNPESFHYNGRNGKNSISSTDSSTIYLGPRGSFSSCNTNEASEQQPEKVRRSSKSVSSFINKLYSLVNDARYQDLITWSPSGMSFLICNVKKFSQVVLPEYFKHSNFSSFVRLLNMYGFHKINKSPRGQRDNENEVWEFSHTQFQRNRPDQLRNIRRKALDSESTRRETGDVNTLVSMLQVNQSDLQRQFHSLQESFSNLLQGFEETRKMQLQQQILLRQLAERQGLQLEELLWQQQQQQPPPPPPGVYVTTPNLQRQPPTITTSSSDPWKRQQRPDKSPMMSSVSSTVSSLSQDRTLQMASNTPLPASPRLSPPVIDPNHIIFTDNNNSSNNNATSTSSMMQTVDANTLGLEYACI